MAQSARDEVVLKIGRQDGDGDRDQSASQPQSRGKAFSHPNSGYQSSSSSRNAIGECSDDDDDDDGQVTDYSSTASFLQNSTIFFSSRKSKAEDPYWRYKRAPATDAKDEDEDSFDRDFLQNTGCKNFNLFALVQWASLILVTATLACTLSVPELRRQKLWGLPLPLWKWEILAWVLICGHLASGWMVRLGVLFAEYNFILKTKVLYFVYGLRKSIQNCIWLGLVLIVWTYILADQSVAKDKRGGVLSYVTKTLLCLLLGTLLWLLKTLVVKVLASSFHVSAFFDRIRESLLKQYLIKNLYRSLLVEELQGQEESIMAESNKNSKLRSNTSSQRRDGKITIERLKMLNPSNVTALRMKRLISLVQSGVLSTLDEELTESSDEDESSLHIRDGCEAEAAAWKIFLNVAKRGSKYIYLDDLKHFMDEDDALKIIHLLGKKECQGISRASLTQWMVEAFKERRSLALSLNDTKTAVDELQHMLDVLVAIIIVIIWLLIFDITVAHLLVLVSSQLLLGVFIFGNTLKNIFEAIIFLFVMHPFDVGDCCEVNGMQMVVEEMNILTTVFRRSDNRIIMYPNSVLASSPISNNSRSPDVGDTVDFSIHISTPMEKIVILRKRIIGYIKSRSEQWHEGSSVLIKDMEDMNRLKMQVSVKHKMNHHNMGERGARRSMLIEEMIKVLRELDIEYRMQPLDVNVRNMPGVTSHKFPSNWTTCAT